jgi:hypothetical protein
MGYDVKVGSFHAREIDFVCERDNERLYVQVYPGGNLLATTPAGHFDGSGIRHIDREFGQFARYRPPTTIHRKIVPRL